MAPKFKQKDVDALLAECHRRCCICHKLCGVKIETAHIKSDSCDIKYAIPVCFECHAEIGHYNPKHARGRKFTEKELIIHKEQWLTICREQPQVLLGNTSSEGVGPLEAMIFELEYNLQAVCDFSFDDLGYRVKSEQFNLAISMGSLFVLPESIKEKINSAYLAISQIETYTNKFINSGHGRPLAEAQNNLAVVVNRSKSKIEDALDCLKKFLGENIEK